MDFVKDKCFEFFSSEEQATIIGQVIEILHNTVTIRICGTEKVISLSLSKINQIKEVSCNNCL